MANMRKYASSRFLKLEDVFDRPRRETVVEVTDGKWDKPVLRFQSGAQLNATNVGTMIAAYGDDSDDWIGVEIELYAGETKFQGGMTDSVLIRPVTPPTPMAKRRPGSEPEPFKDEIPF
jgi:hypothetical protein